MRVCAAALHARSGTDVVGLDSDILVPNVVDQRLV